MSIEAYPHRKDATYGLAPDCRCGSDEGGAVGPGETWGSNCPAALREALDTTTESLRVTRLAYDRVCDNMQEMDRLRGPHITPAVMRRIEALGFTPGSGEPVGFLLGYVEGLAGIMKRVERERDDLAATLANERGEGKPPVEGWLSVRVYGGDGEFRPGWRRGDVVVVRLDPEGPWRVYDVDGTMFSPVLDDDGRPVEAPTARAAILAASAARST